MERANVSAEARSRRRLLVIAALCLAVGLLAGLWLSGDAGKAFAADAPKIPRFSSEIQRDKIIAGIQTTNEKLDRLIRLLESGQARVSVVEAKPAKANRAPTKPKS